MRLRRRSSRRFDPHGWQRAYLGPTIGAVVIIVVALYAAFVKTLPLENHYELRGVFSTTNELRLGSEVRISGIRVGQVASISAGPRNTAIVTMRIDDRSVPIHSDAQLSIEPRLALEGNYYVDVHPGTPSAPVLASGGTIPLADTSVPVQIDQLLDTLTSPLRGSLWATTSQLAEGLGHGAPPVGKSAAGAGYEGLRNASRALDAALGSVTQVATAAQGTQPRDLQQTIASTGHVTAQLAAAPPTLAALVDNYNRVFGAVAANTIALTSSFRELDSVLRVAPSRLDAIDAALPELTRFAGVLQPALIVAPITLRKANRALHQIELLVDPKELPRLLTSLQPVTASLPTLNRRLGALFPLVLPASECLSRNIIPTFNKEVPDGTLSTGRPVWQDMLHMAANLAGISQSFDGNGTTIRAAVRENPTSLLSANLPGIGQLVGPSTITGVDPVGLGPGVSPPYRPDQPCIGQDLTNLALRRSTSLPPSFHYERAPAPSKAWAQLRSALEARDLASILAALHVIVPNAHNLGSARSGATVVTQRSSTGTLAAPDRRHHVSHVARTLAPAPPGLNQRHYGDTNATGASGQTTSVLGALGSLLRKLGVN